MVWWSALGGNVGDVVGVIGKGIGSVMNRFGFTEKLSEKEKLDKTIELIKTTTKTDKLDLKDLKSAREIYITQMNTQKACWLVRQLNGALRPFAGWVALIYLTDKVWVPIANQWLTIPLSLSQRDPLIDLCMTGIIGFFFGFRHMAKTKGTTSSN